MKTRLLLLLSALVLPACGGGGGSGGGPPPPDVTAPAAVADLAVVSSTSTTLELQWTAPGDDGGSGTAQAYELRRSTTAITDETAWAGATVEAGLPVPSVSGTTETFTVAGLSAHTTYFFALRTVDESANVAVLSNSPSGVTTLTPPGRFAALTVSPVRIDLHWLDEAPDESGYQVERSADGLAFALLATLPPGSDYYPDPGRAPSTTYFYRITTLHTTGPPGLSPVVAGTTLPAAGGWRMFARDAAHTAYPRAETGVPPLSFAWSATPGQAGLPLHPAVVEDGRIFLTQYSSFAAQTRIWARDLTTGGPLWDHDYGAVPRLGHASVFQGRVYVQVVNSGNSFLSVREAATGAPVWAGPFPSQSFGYWAPTVLGGRVYTAAGTFGGLYAWDKAGDPLFSNTGLDQYDEWSPLYHEGRIYTYTGSNFRAHHASTGATLWTLSIPRTWTGWGMRSSLVAGDGRIYVAAQPDLAAVDPVSQSVVWTASGHDYRDALAFADGVVYALNDGTLHARDATTGELLWIFLGDRRLSYPPLVANNHLYVCSDANLYALNLGSRSQVATEPLGGWMTLTDNHLLVARPNGVLTAYTLSAGSRPSEASPPGPPTNLTAVAGPHCRIDLSWSAPAGGGVMAYRVERSSDQAAWTPLTQVGYGTTTCADAGVDPGVPLYYRVSAVNAAGASAPSATATATPLAPIFGWPTIGAGPQHTGDVPAEIFGPPANSFWSASVAALNIPLHPVAVENRRVFASASYPHRTLVALNDGGSVAWTHDFGPNVDLAHPAVDRGRVYIAGRMMLGGDGDPKLFCFDAQTGRPLWTGHFRTQTADSYGPIVAGETVFLNEAFGWGIAGYRTRDGRRLFESTAVAPAMDRWTPAWQAGTLYTFTGGSFRAHDPATGAVQWTTSFPWNSTSGVGSVAVLSPTHAYVTSPPDLRAVNLTTQANEWTVLGGGMPSPAYFGTPALSGGKIFVIRGQVVLGGSLEVRDANGLGLLWSFAGDGALKYPPVVANGHVYVSSDANVYAVNLSTQAQAWTLNQGGWLAVADGRLYISRSTGALIVRALQ